MMSAAANMMVQAGEMLARYTPSGEVHAPARPVTTPKRGMQVLFLMCVMHPARDVGMMVKSDVAVAPMAGNPNHTRPPADTQKPGANADDHAAYGGSDEQFHAIAGYSLSSMSRWISPVMPGSKSVVGNS